jgi:class 3 adenylate cyclase/tetratricopeptide (TPR) repeat protein
VTISGPDRDRARGDPGPYVPRIAAEWDLDVPGTRARQVDATLVFVDISGFTALSEKLAARGRIGAEELTDVLRYVFSEMLAIAYARGGVLLKFGGDALLLMFSGDGHPVRACTAAVAMQGVLRDIRQGRSSIGAVPLRMSVGVHTGSVDLFLVGSSHRELLVVGPAASATTRMEHAAVAGEILVSETTAGFLPARRLGDARAGGRLLRWRVASDADPAPVLARPVPLETVTGCIPVALRRHLAESGFDSEHRVASIGFVQYQGVDALLAQDGPDATAAALDRVIAAVQEAADAEEVTFLATDIDEDGGKVILAAGVPRGRDDDEGRLLRAVRRVLDTDLPLAVRVGVNRGHVFAGDIGTDFRRTYTVMGDTVNLAARLMAAAPLGEGYATASVLERSRTVFDADPLEPFLVKGKTDPIQAYRLGETRGPRTERRSRTSFVGRSHEVAQLEGAWDSVIRSGRGAAIVVEAERGFGKSRIVDELRARRPDATTVVIQGEPYGTASAFLALRAPLAAWLALDLGRADAPAQVGVAVTDRTPELAPLAPLLGPVLGTHLDETQATARIAPEFRMDRLADLVEALLATDATGRDGDPLLLVVEDAHWLDDATASLLERLAARADTHPWLVVTTRRPGGEATEGATVLRLGSLDAADAASVVQELTEGAPLRPAEIAALVERAGGSPLFLEELVRVARDRGVDGLPESLDGVAAAEIDALPPLTRTVLRMASVLGGSFETAVLVDMLAEDGVVLDAATLRDLARYLVADGPDAFRFRHALPREVAYESLAYGRRRQLHARAAHALLATGGADQPRADLLALHFSRAQDWARAWDHAQRAGAEAEAASAPREVVVQLTRAVEAARRVDTIEVRELASVWERLGDAHEVLGSLPDADAAFRHAVALVPDDRVLVARLGDKRVVIVGEHQHRHTAAVRLARRVRRDLGPDDTVAARAVRAQLLAHEAAIRFHQGRYREAVRVCEAAVAEVAPGEEPLALATALSVSDAARSRLGLGGDPGLTERALEIYERHGDLVGVAVTLTNLGMLAYFDGQWDEAGRLYRRAIEASERSGDAVGTAISAANLAELLINQGRVDEVEPHLGPALRTLSSLDAPLQQSFAVLQMGRLEARLGERSAMRGWMRDAMALDDGVGAREEGAQTRATFAECEALLGGFDEAATLVAEARAIANPEPDTPLGVLVDRVEASVLGGLGRSEEAFALAASTAERARESGAFFDLVVLLDLLAAHGREESPAYGRERDVWVERLGIVAGVGPDRPT